MIGLYFPYLFDYLLLICIRLFYLHVFIVTLTEVMRAIYETIHISAAVKVQNDHRGTFSNSSNWKGEARKNQGFNGIRTRDFREYRCDTVAS